jgi:peptidoglycan/LPS O-acetylase OafA/YrhL
MFFALSGFLVTGSAIRTRSVRTFLTFRFLRIFPALATEVTLSAVILGPLLTTLPLKDYVSDHHFWNISETSSAVSASRCRGCLRTTRFTAWLISTSGH